MYCWCARVCSYCVCVCVWGRKIVSFWQLLHRRFPPGSEDTNTRSHTHTLSLSSRSALLLLVGVCCARKHTHTSRAKLASCLPMRGGERLRLTDACTRTLHTHTNTLTHIKTLTRTHRLAAKQWRLLRWRQQLSAAFSSSSTCFWFD